MSWVMLIAFFLVLTVALLCDSPRRQRKIRRFFRRSLQITRYLFVRNAVVAFKALLILVGLGEVSYGIWLQPSVLFTAGCHLLQPVVWFLLLITMVLAIGIAWDNRRRQFFENLRQTEADVDVMISCE